MTQTLPALAPDQTHRLERLTREYARYARHAAGLGSVLGGCFAYLILAVDLLGHHGRISILGAYAPLPMKPVLLLTLLPFLWLAARYGLRIWWYQRFGLVEAVPDQAVNPGEWRRRLALMVVFPLVATAALTTIYLSEVPSKPLRTAAFLLLMGATVFALRSLLHGRLERILGTLLFLCPALLVTGLQMAALDSLVALPLVGTFAIILGLKEHLAFRRLERQLLALRNAP
jgi:hypothetical protein